MPDLKVEDGKIIYTEQLPSNIEPVFCCDCGTRVGWADTGGHDAQILYCDGCTADMSEEE